jgi:hypothetical protein
LWNRIIARRRSAGCSGPALLLADGTLRAVSAPYRYSFV